MNAPANDNGTLVWFQRHRVAKLLRTGSAFLVCITDRVAGLPDALQDNAFVAINVGNDILPPMNVEIDKEFLACTMHFGGEPREVEIHWSAVIRSEQLARPNNGGTPGKVAA